MKRHAISLLERKRADFAGHGDSGGRHQAPSETATTSIVEVRDGYDWLRVFKRVEGSAQAAL